MGELQHKLLAEYSKIQYEEIAEKCITDKKWLVTLLQIIIENKPKVSQKAAWVLSFISKKNNKTIQEYLPLLIDNLSKPNLHSAIKRNTLKLFESTNAPANYETKLLDLSILFLKNKKEPIAVRVFAMTVAVNISLIYPELKKEIKEIILEQYNPNSPAYVSRAKRELKRLI